MQQCIKHWGNNLNSLISYIHLLLNEGFFFMGFSEGGSSVRAEGEGGSGLPPCKINTNMLPLYSMIFYLP